MSATPFKTAWTDPEYVRLASYRSPWDQGCPALRGSLPPFLDPWLGDSVPGQDEPQKPRDFTRGDDYAASRCGCKHLVYADEQRGGSCRFCSCADHRPGGEKP